MAGYANGDVPLSLLVHLGGQHYLLPGVNAYWQGLVAEAKQLYGVTLRITGGYNGYRPRFAQEQYLRDFYTSHYLPVAGYEYYYAGRWWKRKPGMPKAAKPGTSPHGAYGAIDVANWSWLAPSEREAWSRFDALCRKWKFATNRVKGELWHIEFLGDAWFVPAWAGGDSKPIEINESEEDDMGYYFYDASNPDRPYGFWNESRGKARLLTTAEWEWRKASASTRRGAPYKLVPVSAGWYDSAVALGTY